MSVSRGARVVAGLVIGLTLTLTITFLLAEALGWTDEAWIRERITALADRPGGAALAATILGALLAADLFLPVPSSVLMTLSGFVCGLIPGALVSFAGAMASAWIGFALCRRFGRGAFRRLIGESEVPRLEAALARRGALVILLSRSVPMLTEVMSCLAGLSAMSSRRFLSLAAAGTLPVCLVYAWAGERSRGDASLAWPLIIAFAIPAVGYGLVWLHDRSSASPTPERRALGPGQPGGPGGPGAADGSDD